MHVMNKHVIVCLVNASSFGGEVFLRVSRQVRYLENSLLDARSSLSALSDGSPPSSLLPLPLHSLPPQLSAGFRSAEVVCCSRARAPDHANGVYQGNIYSPF